MRYYAVALAAAVLPQTHAFLGRLHGPQGVNQWRLEEQQARSKLVVQDAFDLVETEFPAQWFEQPLDHFDKSVRDTFQQRYWVNTRHYDPSVPGPVFVLDGGETSGEGRLPFLDTGIVEILARATGGVGVVLEHRYYGESIAVQNLTTDSLRFLTNEQSAADSANFMANVNFTSVGITEDLTAPGTPWIYYGGSYAGARAAHMRVLYPELTYGAIASSAVTHAAILFWEYSDLIRQVADQKCINHIINTVDTVDRILGYSHVKGPFKKLFGITDLEHDDDFASLLESPIGYWQAKCWDPKYGSTGFDDFCEALSKPPVGHISAAADLPFDHESRMVGVAEDLRVDFTVLNYAKWVKENVVASCPEDSTQEECFGTHDASKFQTYNLSQEWRLWMFQVCTQWGYFMTRPPFNDYPSIVSRHITLDYESKICRQAYPPGEHFTVPTMPNISAVNALGDFDLAADRLAFIDGGIDPWRPATPHSDYALDREDTLLRPFKTIPNGVHHYDEWGYKNLADEPAEIRKVHGEMIAFVMEWLKDWVPPKKTST
ncbi:peptidase S28 [Cylindrobasidium torrendii FP15055 ss-10]|uniref:Peptidase S28 n=1 Tax=Cylindrobasidium torrendii FP15055 ss-10 TaxID=1314674 RepID=A0A0D7AZ19_9AGAR|nr:peptidase S28 [Cylindrobasidium torrendii FP15055 ss-10]